MKFTETPLKGAYIIEVEEITDHRGFFARSWCQKEFNALGLATRVAQTSISFNRARGTLRGMHYQASPHEETKLVRCTRGAIFDVIIDLRPESSTYKEWTAEELTADRRNMLYVPEGFAHGFLTLEDGSEVTYQVTEFYSPGSERGIRYDDPAFGIKWPAEVRVISDKDANWPDFRA